MSLIELNGLDNNSALVIMDKKIDSVWRAHWNVRDTGVQRKRKYHIFLSSTLACLAPQ